MRSKLFGLSLLLVLAGGCGGEYILTVPDQLSAVGDDVTVVARLQRNDFFVVNLAAVRAYLRYQIGEGVERSASTDKLGYSAVRLVMPEKPGRYDLAIRYQDDDGDETAKTVGAYAWDPAKPVIAVDMDPLPRRRAKLTQGRKGWWTGLAKYTVDLIPRATPGDAPSARAALAKLAGKANILYLTRREVVNHLQCRSELSAHGYPDGPVLTWRRQRWHLVPGRFKIPKVVVEARLVSQLGELRKTFSNMWVGISESSLAGKAFVEAGMTAVVVGDARLDGDKVMRVGTWKELAEKGL
ncbi:MAG: hypothetical protein QGH60_13280 [Phycisphaerae bacterium]|jgi:hypothetical protein|nr:hypothetical protein [Phycisphaerae bacterium]